MHKSMYVGLIAVLAFSVLAGCGGKKPLDVPDPLADRNRSPMDTPPPPPPPVREQPPAPPQLSADDLHDVFYDFDSAALTAQARSQLQRNGAKLVEVSNARITIEGHCDERGTLDYNLALGEKRAKSAKDFLTDYGVAASRISTISYGESRPFDLGHDERAWASNRRAHFTIRN